MEVVWRHIFRRNTLWCPALPLDLRACCRLLQRTGAPSDATKKPPSCEGGSVLGRKAKPRPLNIRRRKPGSHSRVSSGSGRRW